MNQLKSKRDQNKPAQVKKRSNWTSSVQIEPAQAFNYDPSTDVTKRWQGFSCPSPLLITGSICEPDLPFSQPVGPVFVHYSLVGIIIIIIIIIKA